MTLYLNKIKRIFGRFEEEDQKILKEYYKEVGIKYLMDSKRVNRSKILLLRDLEDVGILKDNDCMGHKVLQTRALVLDLITTDYTKNTKAIYKPEDWIKEIVRDIEECFDFEDSWDVRILKLYNEKLVEEFKNIFISELTQYGSAGNHLVVNFTFYAKFLSKIDFNFMPFLECIKKQIEPSKRISEKEVEEILE